MARIYVASSWRNAQQAEVVAALTEAGHAVYDFKNPAVGNTGFSWKQCDAHGDARANPRTFASVVTRSPIARAGFALDKAALDWCEVCVMVLPCGRSAHLEAGYACGQGKHVIFLLSADGFEPELMYLLGDRLAFTIDDIVSDLAGLTPKCRIIEDDDEPRCEGCRVALEPGDETCFCVDGGELCEGCAPTWAELVENLRDADDPDLAALSVSVAADIAAGGRDAHAKAVS